MARFFSKFFNDRDVVYDFGGSLGKRKIADIFRSFKVVPSSELNAIISLRPYVAIDGDRPDSISHRLYRNDSYYWTIFFLNNQLRSSNARWPLSTVELEERIDRLWSSLSCLIFTPVFDATEKIFNSVLQIPFDSAPVPLYVFNETQNWHALIQGVDLEKGQIFFERNFLSVTEGDVWRIDALEKNSEYHKWMETANLPSALFARGFYPNAKFAPYASSNYDMIPRFINEPITEGEWDPEIYRPDPQIIADLTYEMFEIQENERLSKITVLKPEFTEVFANLVKRVIKSQ